MSETQLVKSILDTLAWRFKGKAFFWRNSTGALRSPAGALVRFGAVGSPDILGCLAGGRLVALEVKTAKGKVSPYQEAWLEEARALGAVALVVRSVDEALAAVEEACIVNASKEKTPL